MTTLLPPDELERLRTLLKGARRIALVTHHNPDGDAMGCSLGLALALKNAGFAAQVVLPNTPPAFLHWLPGYADCIAWDQDPARCAAELKAADLVFALDFNRPDRTKDLEPSLRAARNVVMIDHHQDPDPFAAVHFSDTSASSTCQMVFDVLHALGMEERIDRGSAIALYTGIMTDTGSFRFSSVTSHTLRVAARLVDHGVEPHDVYDRVMDENSEQRLRLLGFTLGQRMEVLKDQGTTIFWLTASDLKQFQHQPGDTEGLVNYGLSIQGIRLSAFFMERSDGVKISLRSKGDLPVDKLAREHFEGGGHANAAGGRSSETLQATIERFKRLLPAHLDRYPE